jgi:TonB family protein
MAVADELKLSSDSVHAVSESGGRPPLSPFDAPEIAMGAMSRAADIWSLGVTLVRCLSPGRQARENYNPIEQGIAQTIPEPFRHIARECLRPDPKARCKLADIREWLRPAAIIPAAVQGSQGRPAPSPKIWAAIAAIVLVVAIVAVRWATHGKQETPAPTSSQPSVSGNISTQPSASVHAPAATPVHVPAAAPPVAKPPAHSVETPAAESAIVQRVIPDIPASARNTIQGKIRVAVRVAVSPAGEVTNATFVSPGPSKYFANKALEAARRWKFKPPETTGQAASNEWMLRFQFGRGGTEVIPTELPARTH